eukprot:151902_1
MKHTMLTMQALVSILSAQFDTLNTPLPYPMGYFCAATYDEKLITVAGKTDNQFLYSFSNDINLDHNHWATYSVSNYLFYPYQSCIQYDNLIYGLGYSDLINPSAPKLTVFDLSTHLYQQNEVTLFKQLANPCITIAMDELYVIGGEKIGDDYPPTYFNTVQSYNISNDDKWKIKAPINQNRSIPGCSINTKDSNNAEYIYLFGGQGHQTPTSVLTTSFDSIEKYNIYNNKWVLLNAVLSHGRGASVCVYIVNYIYCVGGYANPLASSKVVEVFDPINDKMINANINLNIQREYMSVVVTDNDELLVLGGYNEDYPSSFVDSIERVSLSLNPTAAPTSTPSQSPSDAPSSITYEPTNAPSQSPTDIPSHSPSIAPTIQTKSPTTAPTQSPSQYVTGIIIISYDNKGIKLTYKTYIYLAVSLSLLIVIIIIIGIAHSKYKKYEFHSSPLILFLFYLLDFVSDLFFCINLYSYYNAYDDDEFYLILFIFSTIFLIIPPIASLYEMEKVITKIIKLNDDKMNKYFAKNSSKLYLICFIIGNFYGTLSLFGCKLLDLDLFKLSMKNNEMLLLENKYCIHSALLENIPQIIISTLYSIKTKSLFTDDIVLFTYLFGVISMITSFFTFITRKKLLKNQQIIQSDEITSDLL